MAAEPDVARAGQADDRQIALEPAAARLCVRSLEAGESQEDGVSENVFGLVTTALESEGFWVAAPVEWGD
jgi:hypothetical protein